MTPAQEKLIHDHLGLVHQIAIRVIQKMPPWIELDELEAAGNLGLVEAATRFDPTMEVSFAAWAMLRVRGAMIDPYRGRNYPRLATGLPEESEHAGLLDPAPSVEEAYIVRERCMVISIEATKVRAQLTPAEGISLDMYVAGATLPEIGRMQGRKRGWALYTVKSAKRKMRDGLAPVVDLDKAA